MKQLSLRILRESGKQKLFLVPCLFTFSNALLGFFAIIYALHGKIMLAAYCIVIAALMDFLDGRIARLLGASSQLGMELDSLSDAVSFCLAPAIILYSWRISELGFLGVIALSLYLCSGLLRLAKFNITSSQQQNYFSGLPTPIAALFLMSCIINNSSLQASPLLFLAYSKSCLLLIIACSYCMISRIPFPAFKQYRMNAVGLYILMLATLCCFAGFISGYPMMFISLVAYVISSLGMYLYMRYFAISTSKS